MSRDNSTVYSKSSFDTTESTRRLSKEIPQQDKLLHGTSESHKYDSESDMDKTTAQADEDNMEGYEAGDSEVDDGSNREDDRCDQRSESDSDMDCPDDFDGSVYGPLEIVEKSNHVNDRGGTPLETIRNATEDNTQFGGEQGRLHNDVGTPHDDMKSSDHNLSTTPEETSSNAYPLSTDTAVEGSNTDLVDNEDSLAKTKPEAKDSEKETLTKLDDDDVLDHNEKLELVKNISFENMSKLQQLDRNDPVLRRLFMRPRVSPGETKTIKVDPDIKSMVNEFLRTNVAENFIIARVLRENYATFYAWLASHMQTERNAWAARLVQALDSAEQERKGSLGCRDLLVEAATRLHILARTVSTSLVHGPANGCSDSMVTSKGPLLRHGNVKGFHAVKGGNSNSNKITISDRPSEHFRAQQKQRSADEVSPILRQSSFNVIEVSDITNYESDPGMGRNASEVRNNAKNTSCLSKNNIRNTGPLFSDNKLQNNTTGDKNVYPQSSNSDFTPFGYSINGLVVNFEDDIDWRQTLNDSIDVLVEACDAFLTDRKACLGLISPKSSQLGSLVDVLSTYIQDNQAKDYLKRKEIEKRLETLETENRKMQEEMALLKKTLIDKSEDAFNLRTHLNRLECKFKENGAEMIDKCVGTDREFRSPKLTNTRGLSKGDNLAKSRSPRIVGGEGGGKKVRGDDDKTTHFTSMKSPYASKDPPVVNGIARSKCAANSHTTTQGYFTDTSESGVTEKSHISLTSANKEIVPGKTPSNEVAQPSFIEMSEEKLEKLKHRAKLLETSLHEAITSMDTLNKSTPWLDRVRVRTNGEKPVPTAHLQKMKAAGNHHQTAKNIAYWRKSTFEVTSSTPSRQRLAIGPDTNVALEGNKKWKDQITNDPSKTLHSEPSSLLEGRSIQASQPEIKINGISDDDTCRGDHLLSLKLVSDRSQGLTPRSTTSRVDGYHSEDEDLRGGRHLYQDLSARSEISHKVRARRGQVKQLVSKCLRCQKLFSPTDNHKLACCYHSKGKERLEHYDHTGMLVKVIHAWKCCNQPQDADGCCYGKHV